MIMLPLLLLGGAAAALALSSRAKKESEKPIPTYPGGPWIDPTTGKTTTAPSTYGEPAVPTAPGGVRPGGPFYPGDPVGYPGQVFRMPDGSIYRVPYRPGEYGPPGGYDQSTATPWVPGMPVHQFAIPFEPGLPAGFPGTPQPPKPRGFDVPPWFPPQFPLPGWEAGLPFPPEAMPPWGGMQPGGMPPGPQPGEVIQMPGGGTWTVPGVPPGWPPGFPWPVPAGFPWPGVPGPEPGTLPNMKSIPGWPGW